MIKYEYFDDGKFLIVKFSGNVDKETLLKFLHFIHTGTDDSSLTKILVDFRNSSVIFNEDNLGEISKLKESYLKNETYTSHIVNDPKGTAFSLLIPSTEKSRYHVCSTIEAAINFLRLNISTTELQKNWIIFK